MTTFDTGNIPFQAVGEFIGAESTTDDFELQVRTAPVPGSRVVSMAKAAAIRVGGDRITIYRTMTGYDARIDGVPATITPNPRTLPGGGTIGSYGNPMEAVIVGPDGTIVIVSAVGIWPEYYRLTIQLGLPASRLTHMVGLLGNADGEEADDVFTRAGGQLQYPPVFQELHPGYADSWRISQAESLFDYGAGETTETFTDRTFPDAPARPPDLPPAVRAAAEAQCDLFGIVVPEIRDNCVVDVGITGDPEFATSAATAQEAATGIPTNTGVISLGEATTVTIPTAGQTAVRAFNATAGQKATLSVTGNTMAGVQLTVRSPNGSIVASRFVSTPTAFQDVFTFPDDDTYTITIDPQNQNTGTLTFTLNAVPENTGTTAIGTPTTVTTTVAGENATRTFPATAGQKITLTVTDNTIPGVTLAIHTQGGAFVGQVFLSETSTFRDVMTLPVTGTYTITIDPSDQNTGKIGRASCRERV